MKYLVISDIHGAAEGIRSTLEAISYHGCDAVLCLGDVLYHGPRNELPADYAPKEVIARLNPLHEKITAVRGNCDAEVDQMVLDFPVTADYNILYLGGRKVFMSHGHIYGPEHLPRLQAGDVFLSGHTHIPTCEISEGIYLLNPGSCALPKGTHPRSYGILDEHGFTVYSLDHREYQSIHF
ncbi:MAG: phosphodiesterase [Solobacterium sp.]|nr:phosphodiesterase [Solobacterium sp.]